MGIIGLIAFLVKRKSDVWINISIVSLVTLIYNPYILLSLSYQLSYLGTIGIILGIKVVDVFKKSLDEEDNILGKIKKFFIDSIIVCVSAQVFIFPIMILNFNTFSTYFLISNLLTAPVIGIAIILGFLVILVSYINFPLAFALNLPESCLLSCINIMTSFVSNLPSSVIYLKTPYILSVIIYFILLLGMICVFISKSSVINRVYLRYKRKILSSIKIFLVIYLIIILTIDFRIFEKNLTKVYFLDVGQGDCSLIITEKNKKILIDRRWKRE